MYITYGDLDQLTSQSYQGMVPVDYDACIHKDSDPICIYAVRYWVYAKHLLGTAQMMEH